MRETIFLSITSLKIFPQKQSFKDALETNIDKWMYFLKTTEEPAPQDLVDYFGDDPVLTKAYDELDRFHWTPEELRDYDAIADKWITYQSTLESSYSLGHEAGHQEGLAEGEHKGRQAEKIAIARGMLQQGFDAPTIATILQVTPDELAALLKG